MKDCHGLKAYASEGEAMRYCLFGQKAERCTLGHGWHVRSKHGGRVTLAAVNKALAEKFPGVTLHKGKGYFYFDGIPVELAYTTSVVTCQINALSLDGWLEQAAKLTAESASRAGV